MGVSLVTWARWSDAGYEVSSAGDRRFSALFAEMPDGRTVEMHYQCDVKGFEHGGTAWRPYKGKTNGKSLAELRTGYFYLWRRWAALNHELIDALDVLVAEHGDILTDRFARSEVNQAHALAEILNVKRLREWQMI